MAKKVVFLDAGHGGKDPGAVGKLAYEKEINLSMALQVGAELNRLGYGVAYSRKEDTAMSAAMRARAANRLQATAFLSIHCNAAANEAARGAETYAYSAGSKGFALARAVQAQMAFCSVKNRGVKTANFAVLRETAMPAALVELGFISNASEERQLLDRAWQQKTAAALARAVDNYLQADKHGIN